MTEIAHLEEKVSFVDTQRIGPYRFWYHQHHFEALPGGTRILDQVTYELPFGPLGELVHALWVGPRLAYIFDSRQERVAAIFGTEPPPAAMKTASFPLGDWFSLGVLAAIWALVLPGLFWMHQKLNRTWERLTS